MGAAAPPTRAARRGPRGPCAAAGFGSLRGASGGLAVPRRSRGAGRAGEAEAVPAPVAFPAQTLGRCPRERARAETISERVRALLSRGCPCRRDVIPQEHARRSRVSRAGVSGAVGKDEAAPIFCFFSRELPGAWSSPGGGTGPGLSAGRDERSAPTGRRRERGARSAGSAAAQAARQDPGTRGTRRPPSSVWGCRCKRAARAGWRWEPSGRGGGDSAHWAAGAAGPLGALVRGSAPQRRRELAAPLLFRGAAASFL